MRAFVTGATGFIGSHLVQDLLDHGYQVTALVRTFERAQRLPRGVRVIPADITRPESLRNGIDGADVVFHLAALHTIGARPKDYARMERINVAGTRTVLQLALELGVPKIVYTSTVAVYGDTRGQAVPETYSPDSPAFDSHDQRTKYKAHYEVAAPLQKQGAPVVIASPGKVYGPGDGSTFGRLLRLYVRRRLPVMIGPDSARCWTYAADVAAGLRLAAEQGRLGETYHLTGPALTFREFFKACERVDHWPAPAWLPGSLAAALAQPLKGSLPHLAELLQAQTGLTYLASSEKARRELGWRARSVEDGLPETLAWMRAER
jgi:nucleoside-diphosphate-sugar epimerase